MFSDQILPREDYENLAILSTRRECYGAQWRGFEVNSAAPGYDYEHRGNCHQLVPWSKDGPLDLGVPSTMLDPSRNRGIVMVHLSKSVLGSLAGTPFYVLPGGSLLWMNAFHG